MNTNLNNPATDTQEKDPKREYVKEMCAKELTEGARIVLVFEEEDEVKIEEENNLTNLAKTRHRSGYNLRQEAGSERAGTKLFHITSHYSQSGCHHSLWVQGAQEANKNLIHKEKADHEALPRSFQQFLQAEDLLYKKLVA